MGVAASLRALRMIESAVGLHHELDRGLEIAGITFLAVGRAVTEHHARRVAAR